MRHVKPLLSAAIVAVIAACSSPFEPDERITLKFEGVVSAENRPLEGAQVTLEWTFFVWTLPSAQVATDASGRYVLTFESDCDKGTPLYTSPGNSLILVAFFAGHEVLSNINLNRPLYCTSETQRVDFPLRRTTVTP